MEGIDEGSGVCLSVGQWVWVGGAVQDPLLLALTSTVAPVRGLPVSASSWPCKKALQLLTQGTFTSKSV